MGKEELKGQVQKNIQPGLRHTFLCLWIKKRLLSSIILYLYTPGTK